MSLVYPILESPHRWAILAGISMVAACAGAIMIMGYGWPHQLALIWFVTGFLATLFFLTRSAWDWLLRVQAALQVAEAQRPEHRPDRQT